MESYKDTLSRLKSCIMELYVKRDIEKDSSGIELTDFPKNKIECDEFELQKVNAYFNTVFFS